MSAVNAKQIVRKYVKQIAEFGPLAPRLRALGGKRLLNDAAVLARLSDDERRLAVEREGFADVVDRATARVCDSGLPHYIDSPDHWPFFAHAPSDARTVNLVHDALDAARQEYKKQTGWSGGNPKPGALTRLNRFTDNGQHNANEPTRMIARQKQEAAEQRVLDIRAAEDAAFTRAADEYAARQTKPKHIEAVRLLRLGLSYEEIRRATCNAQGRVGVSEKILKPRRDALTEIANRHLLTDEDGLPYTDLSPDVPQRVADDGPPMIPGTETSSDEVLAAETPSLLSGKFELSNTGSTVTPWKDADLGGGNTLATAAYSVGEEAQLDARDYMDRGDSANYEGAGKKGTGFTNHMARSKGEPKYGESTLASGREHAPWTMTEPPRATITDEYADLLKAIETGRVEGTFDPSRVESEPRMYWDPNANGAGGGAWVDTPPQATVIPPDRTSNRSRGDGRVRISARKERVALLKGYALDGASRDLRRQATEAIAVAKALTERAREAENWKRLRKIARKLGIPEGELRRLKSQFDRQGMSIYKAFGLGDLLSDVVKPPANGALSSDGEKAA